MKSIGIYYWKSTISYNPVLQVFIWIYFIYRRVKSVDYLLHADMIWGSLIYISIILSVPSNNPKAT